ncbi:hypothetical protein KOW79_021555 [Hemibagrus wyckioides]|uniref:Uncharacterized protein n=2 Tax=Hemibagrus wyckioides TaxID=337641 RepID=A0A9D3N6V7_9TELE|nr:hypothetical protein KOW79_021555 [Hemibagrus wyckioides]
MSARLRTLSSVLHLNNTYEENDSRNIAYEFRVFNISMLSLSACVLTVTAIACCVSYVNRWRRWKRVREYESAVACDLDEESVNLKDVQKSQSLHKSLPVLRRLESFRKDKSNIYYIYTTPLPVRCHDYHDADNNVRPTHTTPTLTDPRDGIILDPPTFYMRLQNS